MAGLSSIMTLISKNLSDQLAIVGDPFPDSDTVLYLLKYGPIVTSITSKFDSLSFDAIQSLLMTHESRLECHLSIADLSMKLQENLAFRSGFRKFSLSCDSGSPVSPVRGSGTSFFACGSNYSRPFSPGCGPSSIKLICLLRTRVGHSGAVFHYRFGRSFRTPVSSSTAFLCEHDERDFGYDSSVYLVDTCPDLRVFDNAVWYADSSASNHVVSSTYSLSDVHPYASPAALMVGNGKTLYSSYWIFCFASCTTKAQDGITSAYYKEEFN